MIHGVTEKFSGSGKNKEKELRKHRSENAVSRLSSILFYKKTYIQKKIRYRVQNWHTHFICYIVPKIKISVLNNFKMAAVKFNVKYLENRQLYKTFTRN